MTATRKAVATVSRFITWRMTRSPAACQTTGPRFFNVARTFLLCAPFVVSGRSARILNTVSTSARSLRAIPCPLAVSATILLFKKDVARGQSRRQGFAAQQTGANLNGFALPSCRGMSEEDTNAPISGGTTGSAHSQTGIAGRESDS